MWLSQTDLKHCSVQCVEEILILLFLSRARPLPVLPRPHTTPAASNTGSYRFIQRGSATESVRCCQRVSWSAAGSGNGQRGRRRRTAVQSRRRRRRRPGGRHCHRAPTGTGRRRQRRSPALRRRRRRQRRHPGRPPRTGRATSAGAHRPRSATRTAAFLTNSCCRPRRWPMTNATQGRPIRSWPKTSAGLWRTG